MNKIISWITLSIVCIMVIWLITLFFSIRFAFADNPEPMCLHCDTKVMYMRITGYKPTGNQTALARPLRVGRSAAVSPNCDFLLGEDVYVHGHGVWTVEDLTAEWVGKKFEQCTLDLSAPCETTAMRIGNKVKRVVRLTNEHY